MPPKPADKKGLPTLPLNPAFFRPGERVCVAVSGGADSVALLLALHEANRDPHAPLGLVLSALHIHHGLRGAEADADEAFVRSLCEGLAIPLRVATVDTPARQAAQGEGPEEAARELRYAEFRRLLEAGETDTVATAHTLNDQAETVLLKLMRGAWLEGLSGIAPDLKLGARGRVVRPLLGARREEIERFLRARDQPWREDSSNADTALTRNRARHVLLPALRAFNPAVDDALAAVAELARDDGAYFEAETARLLTQLLLPGKPVRGGGRAVATAPGEAAYSFELERLRGVHPALQRRLLRGAAERLGLRPTFDETARLMGISGLAPYPGMTGKIGGKLELRGGVRAERTARELRLWRQA